MAEGSEIVEIVLERGSHGLGFNIRGGVDIPYIQGDTGVFVTKIREDGAAFQDGRLKEGDKIVEVNGYPLDRVTHNEAVQQFVTAGEVVKLKIIQGAEEMINRNQETEETNTNDPNTKSSSQLYYALGVIAFTAVVVGSVVLYNRKFR